MSNIIFKIPFKISQLKNVIPVQNRTRLYYGRVSSVRDRASPERFSPAWLPSCVDLRQDWCCPRHSLAGTTGNKPTLHASPDDPFHPHSLRLHNSAVNNESSRTMHGAALSLRATMTPGSNQRRPIQVPRQVHLAGGGGITTICEFEKLHSKGVYSWFRIFLWNTAICFYCENALIDCCNFLFCMKFIKPLSKGILTKQ